jgi:hypothetical protein
MNTEEEDDEGGDDAVTAANDDDDDDGLMRWIAPLLPFISSSLKFGLVHNNSVRNDITLSSLLVDDNGNGDDGDDDDDDPIEAEQGFCWCRWSLIFLTISKSLSPLKTDTDGSGCSVVITAA